MTTVTARAVPGRLGGHNADIVLAAGVLLILGIMLIPLPTFMLDLLLSTSLALSLVILLMTIYTLRPLTFLGLSTVLLLVTLFRLSLKRGLRPAHPLHAHAGKVIESFGNFVVGGNFAVGIIASPSCRSSSSSSSPRAPGASPRWRRASCWTACPASRWPSTPT